MISQLYALKEIRQDAVIALQQFQIDSRVEGQIERKLSFLYTEDIVDEAIDILLLDQIPRRYHFQLTLKQSNHPL